MNEKLSTGQEKSVEMKRVGYPTSKLVFITRVAMLKMPRSGSEILLTTVRKSPVPKQELKINVSEWSRC